MARPDSNMIRIAGYVLVAGLMLAARRRERRRIADADGAWPLFWVVTCGFLLAMAAARAVEAGDLAASLGRRAANDGGWYLSRGPVQGAVVGAVGVSGFVVATVALSRTTERRRRYLPVGVMVLALATFAAVRIISLHQVDSLMYRTHIGGARVGTVIELTLLALTGLATMWRPPAAGRSDQIDRLV